jgi:NTP pyrophosphatase (non-canonical NTP hydrolase)
LVRRFPHCGEAGEFANLVKKIERGSLRLGDASVRLKLAMELTDTFVYMLNLAGLLGIDLEKSYHLVRGENEKRFMKERAEREAR